MKQCNRRESTKTVPKGRLLFHLDEKTPAQGFRDNGLYFFERVNGIFFLFAFVPWGPLWLVNPLGLCHHRTLQFLGNVLTLHSTPVFSEQTVSRFNPFCSLQGDNDTDAPDKFALYELITMVWTSKYFQNAIMIPYRYGGKLPNMSNRQSWTAENR